MKTLVLPVLTLAAVINLVSADKCVPRSYGYDSVVCVCNATQCGALEPPIGDLGPATRDGSVLRTPFVLVTSSRDGLRLHRTYGNFTRDEQTGDEYVDDSDCPKCSEGSVRVTVDRSIKYQTINGFGVAMTDSAAMNIQWLGSNSSAARLNLLKAFFGEEGNRYKVVRVPLAGTDDSLRKYSYDDVPDDMLLQNFSLASEDHEYKIPVLLEANKLAGGDIKFVATSWTAPPWMKASNNFVGGELRKTDEIYQLWAQYLVRSLIAFREKGVRFWAMTTGNEPLNGYLLLLITFNSMGWKAWDQGRWIAEHLGPTLKNSSVNDTLVLAHDDQRVLLPWAMNILFGSHPEAEKYISGIAFHWYWTFFNPTWIMETTHELYPNKFLLGSEACNGWAPWDFQKVKLGSWSRAEAYMDDILWDLNAWTTGWVEWSSPLNMEGGPTWDHILVDSSVLVNLADAEFLLQPTYFAMAHASRFLPPGSQRVSHRVCVQCSQGGFFGLLGSTTTVHTTAFVTPDDKVVLVMHNAEDRVVEVTVRDPLVGVATLSLHPRSFNTLVYSALSKTSVIGKVHN